MKKMMVFLAAVSSLSLCMAAPVIRAGSVSFSQNPGSRQVCVTYVLDEDPGIVTFDVQTNGVSIGARHIKPLAGDVNRLVQPGENKKIFWRPDKAWPGHKITDGSVSVVVTAWATNTPPDYMMIDLAGGSQIPAAERTTYYTHPDAIPFEGGVSNDLCKTDYLVFRKCPAANVTWRMGTTATEQGSPEKVPTAHYVTFTNDFWMAVYELTQRQFSHFIEWPSGDQDRGYFGCCFTNAAAMRPVEFVQYYWLRGWSDKKAAEITSGTRKYWPETGHDIKQSDACGGRWGSPYLNNPLYTLRNLTGQTVDFPTEAQWEFAARAGPGGNLPDGTAFAATVGGESGAARLHRYARTAGNGGVVNGIPAQCETSAAGVLSATGAADDAWRQKRETWLSSVLPADGGTAVVGSYLPNAWGFYDMNGNVAEFCLDNWTASEEMSDASVTDPAGPPTAGKDRVARGGSWADAEADCLSSSRSLARSDGSVVSYGFNWVGFRLCIVIP